MLLRECIAHVLDRYLPATSENFALHPIAKYLRHDFPNTVANFAENNGRLIFKGSAGQGNWVKGPWVAIFDQLITSTSQKGFYPVYLFREDMQGVYLSLNQGMTEMKTAYKSSAKIALRARAGNFRALLGSKTTRFSDLEIDLAPTSRSNDTAFYEAGNVCAKFYSVENLPSELEFVDDLRAMLKLYESLLEAELNVISAETPDDDAPPNLHYEDATKFRLHKRVERNSKLTRDVKKLQGYICAVCSIDFEKRYGPIGKEYIEAHHLIPVSSIKGTKVTLDPIKDFAVLCSNCHRMIHRSGCLDNIEMFKRNHFHQ